ncbi:MAG TPA: potassium-transporting ATPase subunit KdpC [Ruminiclostridium sp.]|nr:potassium-transporting ATPase subunit KdpC [Ruminiclostridium sp.]
MKNIFRALTVGIVFILFCGFAYPLLVFGIGQLAFPWQANGSMVTVGGKVVGSQLIGQDFKDNRFFHGRVSAVNYNTFTASTAPKDMSAGSGSSNYAPSNPNLTKRVKNDVAEFLKQNPTVQETNLPADLFTSSFSGLDPDISPAAAEVQVDRIVKATGISKTDLEKIIRDDTADRDLGIFGEKRVNVLKANLEIYNLLQKK